MGSKNSTSREKINFTHTLKSARFGLIEAQYEVGLMYANGIGVAHNIEQALEWIRRAAERGYPAAQYLLGTRYANGVAVQTQTIVASGLPSGNYNVAVSNTPTTVEVTFGSVATVFTITTPLPNMRVKTKLINYTIAPRNGVVNGW